MQSGSQQQGPPPPGQGPCRSSSSSSPSPSSSSASMHPQQPHLQNQQQNLLQSFQQQQQQQFMRKSQGDEALMAYQAGGIPGVVGASNACGPSGMTQLSQQPRSFIDMGQQAHVPSLSQDDGQVKAQSQMQAQAYLQYAFQTAQNKVRANIQSQQQQGKPGFVGAPITDQDVLNNLKLQELMRYQAANQAQTAAMYKKTSPQMVQTDKPPMDSGQTSNEPKNEVKSQQTQMPQLAVNMPRPTQSIQNQQLLQNYPNNQQTNMTHLQALYAWAMEKNIDIFSPANAHMIPQILVQWQARLAALSKTTENNNAPQTSRVMPVKPYTSSPVQDHVGSSNGNVGQGNSKTDNHSSQGGLYPKSRSSPAPSATLQAPASSASIPNPPQPHHFHSQGSNHQVERVDVNQNGASAAPHSYGMASSAPTVSQAADLSSMNHTQQSTESLQMQYYRQLQANKNTQSGSNERAATNVSASSQGNYTVTVHQQYGFTKMQLQCLKSQILAFRRLKRGEKTLPPDVLQTLAPPPLHLQQLQQVESSQDSVAREKSLGQGSNEQPKTVESHDKQFVPPNRIHSAFKEEKDSKGTSMIEENKPAAIPHSVLPVSGKDASSINVIAKEEKFTRDPLKKDQEHEHAAPVKNHSVNDSSVEKMNQMPSKSSSELSFEVKKLPAPNSTPATKDTNVVKRYRGPLFDVPPFGKKPVSNGGASLSLGYDIKDLLLEEGKDVFNRKRSAHLKKIEQLLSVKLDRKRIRPDLVVKLQIEERKLQLLNLQARLRDEVEQEQQEIMAMGDRPYRKFVRLCERQRTDLARQVQISQKAIKEKHLKAVFQWRKRLLEAHWSIRDARTTRNRGVAKYHERMLKEFSKRKDEDRNKRMEALKNNDVERYRQMLLEQQNQVPGDQQTRLDALQDFLSQTEEYLGKLGGKITAAKSTQEMEEAAMVAAAAARSQGLSEEEVTAAAACARQEVITRKKFTEMSACKNDIPMNKYYNLAHSIDEKVVRQPSMLRVGTLRDYQLVGLQWMLSLYNNKLNGILADEMGLGKTVQVMALIAYLIEFKGNYGPHLIIVPNAVMVNWKSELYNWLPTLSCIYYVGGKDQRNKLYSQEVCARKFNVLVTTYEYIMRDRSKLSRVDWRYIIIDEAQRMKDRESRLARDLDRFRCQRRLLLTGTPLQNDLQELWSLLNLLLPEVFDNRKAFQDWFSKPFQKDLPNAQSSEDDWLETEKKVIIINRLHQILEPFMLRRRVEDVEGSLPAKVPIVLRCKMSALQGAIYDWIKATGSIRLDPESEERRILNNSKRQIRAFVPLQNRCMELRKVCNHPFLNYPFRMEYHNDYIVRSCGKLWILDRILVKFHRSGHRVLLFSTMTKLLDILEEYLQWRHLQYRRIDGTTSLEDRETAIHEFNKPGSDCFVFLLSIRAAGRGLNLQSADTVVIYDPDPNPKNEEQAVARAHRIGQKREVRVIYMEAVVETIPSYEKEDELRSGGLIDDEDELAGKDRYMGSVESLVRNNIQQYKIDMADEVINAGCFDQKTTQEDRRKTLETLLRDEERFQETVHDVPSLHEVNRMIARSEEEIEMFDRMDEEMDWPDELVKHHQIPKWLRVGSREVNNATSSMSKRSLKRGLVAPIGTQEEEDKLFEASPIVTPEKKSNNLNQSLKKAAKESSNSKKPSINILRPLHTSDGGDEFIEASMDEKDESSVQELDEEEEGEIREEDLDDEENSQDANPIVNVQVPFQDVKLQHNDNENISGKTMEIMQSRVGYEREAESSESSFHNAKLNQVHVTSPAASIQKFGSLAAIEAKPATHSKTMGEELEEGEIVQSGDSHMECQQSESCPQEREEGDEEQVLQPKTKRKRTMRTRPRLPADKTEDKTSSEKKVIPPGNMYQQSFNHSNSDHTKVVGQGLPNKDHGMTSEMNSDKSDHLGAMSKRRKVLPTKEDSLLEALPYSKQRVLIKNNRCNGYVESSPDVPEHSTERLDTKAFYTGGSSSSVKGHMSDIIQKKCKTIYGKLHGAINLSKRNENPGHHRSTASHIDPRIIEQRLDRFEYGSVLDFATDVQLMLENISRHPNYPIEVKMDARRLQTVFLQRIAQTFPDVDFSSMKTRSLVSISHNTTCASPKQLPFQSRVHKSQEDLNLVSDLPPTRHAARSSNVVDSDTREKLNHRENFTRTPKESKVIFDDRLQHKERGKGEKAQVTHPGDLVICKKKRKDRDKVGVKSRLINTVPEVSQPNRAMPPKDIWHPGQVMQQQAHGWPQFAGMEKNDNNSLQVEKDAQWAKPVKRLRTDTGKRRPSHI